MRQENRRTRHPGVKKLKSGGFRIRMTYTDPRTGLRRELDREYPDLVDINDAVRTQADLRAQALSGQLNKAQEQPRLRLSDYAASWLTGKRKMLERSTLARYATALDVYILPALGDVYVDAITRSDCIRFRDEHPRSPVTANSDLRVFKSMMADAVVELDLPRNPFERVSALPEDAHYTDEEPNLLYHTEVKPFLDAVAKRVPQYLPLFATMVLTGMRVGEATALLWSEVNLDTGFIRVCRSQYKQKAKARTKTRTNRSVSIPQPLLEIMRTHRVRMRKAQAPGLKTGLCFPNTKGGITGISTLRLPLQKALAEAGIERRVTVHGLRRTYNNMLRQVTNLMVQKSMTGHTTDQMAEHYSHVNDKEKQAAAEGLTLLVSAQSGDESGDAQSQTKTAAQRSPLNG